MIKNLFLSFLISFVTLACQDDKAEDITPSQTIIADFIQLKNHQLWIKDSLMVDASFGHLELNNHNLLAFAPDTLDRKGRVLGFEYEIVKESVLADIETSIEARLTAIKNDNPDRLDAILANPWTASHQAIIMEAASLDEKLSPLYSILLYDTGYQVDKTVSVTSNSILNPHFSIYLYAQKPGNIPSPTVATGGTYTSSISQDSMTFHMNITLQQPVTNNDGKLEIIKQSDNSLITVSAFPYVVQQLQVDTNGAAPVNFTEGGVSIVGSLNISQRLISAYYAP